MNLDKKSSSVLKKIKKESREVLKSQAFTEFFYLNSERKVIEFLKKENVFLIDMFFRELLPEGLRQFVKFKILNDEEEEISTWYFEEELAVLVFEINWGLKQEEVSLDLNINSFVVASIDSNGIYERRIDLRLLNEFLISFLTGQAKDLSSIFEHLSKVE